jgi:hypothetical protein
LSYYIHGDWGLGIGDGDWAQSPIPINYFKNILDIFTLFIYKKVLEKLLKILFLF